MAKMLASITYNGTAFEGVDTKGYVLPFGKLYILEARSNIIPNTYKDSSASVLNEYPIILDEGGRADVYLKDGVYKLELRDKDGIHIHTVDNYDNRSGGIANTPTTIRNKAVVYNQTSDTTTLVRDIVGFSPFVSKEMLSHEQGRQMVLWQGEVLDEYGNVMDNVEWKLLSGGNKYVIGEWGKWLEDSHLMAWKANLFDNIVGFDDVEIQATVGGKSISTIVRVVLNPIVQRTTLNITDKIPKTELAYANTGDIIFRLDADDGVNLSFAHFGAFRATTDYGIVKNNSTSFQKQMLIHRGGDIYDMLAQIVKIDTTTGAISYDNVLWQDVTKCGTISLTASYFIPIEGQGWVYITTSDGGDFTILYDDGISQTTTNLNNQPSGNIFSTIPAGWSGKPDFTITISGATGAGEAYDNVVLVIGSGTITQHQLTITAFLETFGGTQDPEYQFSGDIPNGGSIVIDVTTSSGMFDVNAGAVTVIGSSWSFNMQDFGITSATIYGTDVSNNPYLSATVSNL